MDASFGSFSWAQRFGGRMTSSERLVETLHGLSGLVVERFARLGRGLGLRPRAIRMLLTEVPISRSPLVTAAERALAGAPQWVVAHSMRTYLWGALLGLRDAVPVDAEVLLVASLLHDLGLVHRDGARCFALRGAEKARSIALAAGAETTFADRVAEAISTHLNVRATAPTPEARLVRAGAGFDVVGDRFDEVDPVTRKDVVMEWPRDGFVRSLRTVIRDEAEQHPDTRIGFLCHTLGFLRLVGRADRRFEADRD